MPRSKLGKKRIKPISCNVVQAAEACLSKQLSLRCAAKQYNISKSTLARHIKNHLLSGQDNFVYNNSQNVKQVFTDIQETELVNYISECANMHYGLSTKEVRRLAYDYAKVNKTTYPASWDVHQKAGKTWFSYFLKRHSDISLRKPQATSLARSTAFNKTNVNLFFNKLQEVITKNQFSPERIFNIDETGVSTVHTPVKILTKKGTKQVGSITSGERGANITIISCINAIGNSIPPLFIFPRVFFKDHMLKGAPIGSVGVANSSGWSNSDIFIKYLKHFINHSNASLQNKCLLILDNHESHISVDALNLAKQSGIIMLTFPPHTSHKLQPLDRTVFGPLKKYYNTACNEWLLSHPGKMLSLYDVAECVGKAYPSAFTSKNILSGFAVSGIYPFNRNVFRDDEFLSSFVSDRPDPELPIPFTPPHTSATTSSFCSTSSEVHVTPQQIRPYPKSAARKIINKRGRKPGKCRIVTDTPEKAEIELMHEMRQNKKKAQEKKQERVKKVLQFNNSSSSEVDYETESESSLDDVEFGIDEIANDKQEETLNVQDFVLVKIASKKTIKFYIALITEINSDVINVRYLKKNKLSGKFLFGEEKIYELPREDIIFKIGKPHYVGGTARQSQEMAFDIDLTMYNVE